MSRLGKTPIKLSDKVECKISPDGLVTVKGPKGEMKLTLMNGISAKVDGQNLIVEIDEKIHETSKFHGLYRSLINNMVIGVTQGFEKKLKLVGVGYRAAIKGNALDLSIGKSHPVLVEIPKGLTVKVDKSVDIIIDGIDKQLVGQFAASVRELKKPEPYKGKGIRYHDEHVRKKAGKAKGK